MKQIILLAIMLPVLLIGSALGAGTFEGDFKVGYIWLDEEGNQAVHQPTYNLYQGGALSLENFSYRMDNGVRVYGDLENITMNNRNLFAGISKSGLFGLTARNNKYRRMYNFDGTAATKRRQTNVQAWVEPIEYVRVFGGWGQQDKEGQMLNLFDFPGFRTTHPVDYLHNFYNVGARFKYQRYYLSAEFRGSDYQDDLRPLDDRTSQRYKVTAVAPVWKYDWLLLNGGFQHYEVQIEDRGDTLTANTGWGGLRAFIGNGWSGRYSFIWDRARTSSDLAATDNIAHAFYVDKVWRGEAGITVGYRFSYRDDLLDELSGDSYFASLWFQATPNFRLRGGFGSETLDIDGGTRLIGEEVRNKYWGSARYTLPVGYVRLKVQSSLRENDDINSSADYVSIAPELYLRHSDYGEITATYAYLDGEYENSGGTFELADHVLDGDIKSAMYKNTVLGFGATYYRGKDDTDIESFTIRLSAAYHFMGDHALEVKYAAHNFDNFNDPLPYTEFYTANVVEVYLTKVF